MCIVGGAICPGVCDSHGDFPLASSIRRICECNEATMDHKSYFLARGKTPCKATPPLLRL